MSSVLGQLGHMVFVAITHSQARLTRLDKLVFELRND